LEVHACSMVERNLPSSFREIWQEYWIVATTVIAAVFIQCTQLNDLASTVGLSSPARLIMVLMFVQLGLSHGIAYFRDCYARKRDGPMDFFPGEKVSPVMGPETWHNALRTPKKLVLAEFYSTTCPQSRSVNKAYGRLSTQFSNVHFCKISIKTCAEIANLNKIRVTPTFKLFEAGREIGSQEGWNEEWLVKTLMENGASHITESSDASKS